MKKLILVGYLIFVSLGAQANLIVVNSNQDAAIDDNLCTLREALVAANYDVAYYGCAKGLGDDLIWVLFGTSGDSIQLNNQLAIIDGVEIQGPSADKLVLIPSNNHDGHIFQINTDRDVSFKDFRIGGARSSAIDVVEVKDLTIEDVKFLNNTAASTENGGALNINENNNIDFNQNRTVSIRNSEFSGNRAVQGGAINIEGDYLLKVENTIFENNSLITAQGMPSYGSAISKSTDDQNFVLRDSDMITGSQFLNQGTLYSNKSVVYLSYQNYVIDQTVFIDNNDSPIAASSGLGLVKNALFTGTTDEYAILSYFATGEITVLFSTFFDNIKAIGASQSATVYVKGNIFDGDGCDENVTASAGSILSSGYNIEQDNSPSLRCTSLPSDLTDSDPMLLPLGTYGGNIPNAPPSPISPLVDAGAACNTIDLSGVGRPRDGDGSGTAQCDIGAVERPDAHLLSVAFSGTGSGQVNLSDFDLSCYSTQGCAWPLPQNETYSLQPVADSGSTFIQWGSACSGDTGCDVTMDAAKQVNAEFTQVVAPVTLTVVKNLADPQLGLTVTSSPAGINCGNTCQAGFIEGDVVSLTADVEPGTLIDNWQNCDLVLQNGRLCKVGLSTDTTVTVHAIADPDVIFADGFE